MSRITFTIVLATSISCSSGRAPLDPNAEIAGDDTGSNDDDSTDNETDDDGDGNDDDDEPEDEPEDEPDFSVWNGERNFEYDSYYDDYDCEASVDEDGTQITSGRAYDAIRSECPDCEYIYEVDVSPDEICGWIGIDTYTYRGLIIDGNRAEVWRFEMDDGDLETAYVLDDDADFDGWVVEYQYESELYDSPLYADGHVEFPILN